MLNLRQNGNQLAGINLNMVKNNGLFWIGIFLYCLTISLIFLLICTKSSPLYPLNDWVDSNIYFTMGKGMMNGAIPYRDLFEVKGPLLYLIHGLAYLISNTTFLGVYIFEVNAFSIFLYYCHKTILLFMNIKYSIISLPLIAAIILNTKAFSHGDSAEEFCLPFIAISLFHLMNYFRNVYPNPMNNGLLLINGCIAGCILWIKFTVLGFWLGWIFAISIQPLLSRQYFGVLKSWTVFLGGMFLATLPWLVYFGMNNSIIVWLETYLYITPVYYSAKASFLEMLGRMTTQFVFGLASNPILGLLLIIGIIAFTLDKRFVGDRLTKTGYLSCIVLLAYGTYGGGRGYIYYFLIFSPFVLLGFIAIMDTLRTKYDGAVTMKKAAMIALIIVLTALPLTLNFNHNTYMLGVDKQELFQYRFAAAMSETEGKTLLNYGRLDLGLYTVTNVTPNVRFFFKPNIDHARFPLIMDEQNRYIKERSIDYVVTVISASQDSHKLNIPYLYENYELVMEYDSKLFQDTIRWGNEFIDAKYLLFRIK